MADLIPKKIWETLGTKTQEEVKKSYLATDADKKWFQNKLSYYDKYLKKCIATGKVPNFDYFLYVLKEDDFKNSDKSKRNNTRPTNKQSKNNIMHLRKPHMPLYIKQRVLENHIKEHIESIVPSKIPKEISSLFPQVIWDTMSDNIQKDIKELFKVYQYQQWTATTLMASRLLENILKVHVEFDLKKDTIKNIGEAIEILKKHKYDNVLLKDLDNYRIKRNNFMHGHERASSSVAKESVVFVISKTLQIYNIELE